MNITKEQALDLILDVLYYLPTEEFERSCFELDMEEVLDEDEGRKTKLMKAAAGMSEQDVEDAVNRLVQRI